MTGKTDELVALQKDRNEEELNSTLASLKLDFNPLLPPKSPRFSPLVGYNI